MIENFITADMLKDYAILVTIVFAVVQFTKELGWLAKVPTRLYSAIIALLVIVYSYMLFAEFVPEHIPLYIFTAIFISATANGVYDLATKTSSNKI